MPTSSPCWRRLPRWVSLAYHELTPQFAQIQIRDTEIDELTNIMSSDNCPMEVKGGATSAQGKVNIL